MFSLVLLIVATIFHSYQLLSPFGDASIGLYLHIANDLLHGSLPYTHAWEYKPPGLFALFAAALWFSHNGKVADQLLAIVANVATALAIGRLAASANPQEDSTLGRFAALLSLTLSTEHDGLIGDAEVLLVPFVAWAVVVAARRNLTSTSALVVGILCSAALQMKLSALMLLVVPATLVVVRSNGERARSVNMAAALAGFSVPIAIEMIWYLVNNAMHTFIDVNIGATLRRAGEKHANAKFSGASEFRLQLRILAPAVELGVVARADDRTMLIAACGWLLSAILSIMIIGEFYERQFTLLEAPTALLGALGAATIARRFNIDGQNRQRWATVFLLLSFALHDYYQVKEGAHAIVLRAAHRPAQHTYLADLVATLRDRGKCSHNIYIIRDTPWLYDLLDSHVPTRYVYSDHLLQTRLVQMTGIDAPAELKRIFNVERPSLVVVGGLATMPDATNVDLVRSLLKRSYLRIQRIDATTIYQRRSVVCSPFA